MIDPQHGQAFEPKLLNWFKLQSDARVSTNKQLCNHCPFLFEEAFTDC